jgi:Tol biopolymer transport system component
MSRILYAAAVTALCLGVVCPDASAQYFGRNKVEYVDFDFKVFSTEHFDVYHYRHEEEAARLAARLAERWYARFARVLGHELATRQPLILYGSHPEFAQTNVVSGFLEEGIGGVTESSRRRIVMPFGPTLGETDRVLGHEIVHAFQFDMLRRYGGALAWPRWAIEGMAQYLALGATDGRAVMWLRDAVQHDLLPSRQSDATRKFSPYLYGHAWWAWIAGRYGDRVLGDALRAGRKGTFDHRIRQVTGKGLDEVFADWLADAQTQYGLQAADARFEALVRPLQGGQSSRLRLGPALSPDGQSVLFFSEQDRLSLDLFLADTETGAVTRKLATLAASAKFESLEAIRSAGAWSWNGDRIAFAAVERGRSSLVIVDMDGTAPHRTLRFPRPGQILTPAWSPDGHVLAFSVLEGGVTNLYAYDLRTSAIRQLTNDAYADLQPAWSPDGQRIVFVTDRFSTDLDALRLGTGELATMDVASGTVERLPAIDGAKYVSPQWSRAGDSVYFIADPDGIRNVYRVDLASGAVAQITDSTSGVTGMIDSSPALSMARQTPALAFTVYSEGQYQIHILRGEIALAGKPFVAPPASPAMLAAATTLPPVGRADDVVAQALRDDRTGLPKAAVLQARAYKPALTLDRVGQPYVSTGGGPLGSFLRAGGSLGFGDLLGERRLSTMVQVGSRARDLALGVYFLNRERRWNWGAVAELEPSLRRLPRRRITEVDGEPALAQETEYFQRIQLRVAGLLAYPLSHARRLEFTAGVRHAQFDREVRGRMLSLSTPRVLSESHVRWDEPSATMGEVSAAFVGDTAVVGPTSPILGSRYRFEIAPTVGGLASTRVLLDYRRYLMPAKPLTLAARVVHLGQYGPDADDQRLAPTFLGSRYFVRGYSWSSIQCEWDAQGACAALEELLGSRLLVTNLELRVPLVGMFARDIRYGPLPAEGFLFADSGAVWSRVGAATLVRAERRTVSSAGAGVRVNALGIPIEVAAVHAFDQPARGWSFDFAFRTGF